MDYEHEMRMNPTERELKDARSEIARLKAAISVLKDEIARRPTEVRITERDTIRYDPLTACQYSVGQVVRAGSKYYEVEIRNDDGSYKFMSTKCVETPREVATYEVCADEYGEAQVAVIQVENKESL